MKERIDSLEVEGSTNMAAAFDLAAEKLSSSSRGRAVVVVTDGMPDSTDAVLRAANKLKSLGIDIITIGTNDADQRFLVQFATCKELAVHVPQQHLGAGIKTAAKLLPGGNK